MTNKIVLRSVEEVMNDYKPQYQPIFPLFIGGNSQQYATEVGKNTFTRIEAMGDLRAKRLTPKDTELHQVSARSSAKEFKKYFFAAQFINSELQDNQGVETVVAQTIDELNKQFDEMLLTGEGTAANNVMNNALYWSADSNYTLNSSDEMNDLAELHTKVMSVASDADQVTGRKIIMFYGDAALTRLDGLYSTSQQSFKKVLQDALGSNYSIVKMPKAITPSGASGFIVISMEQIKTHYTEVPTLDDQGINAEKKYSWHNLLLGSLMIDVLAKGGIIRQPLTFA